MVYPKDTSFLPFYVPPISPEDLEPFNSTDPSLPSLPSSSDIFHFPPLPTTETLTSYNTRTTPNETATDLNSDLGISALQPIPQHPAPEPQPISLEKEVPTTVETASSQSTSLVEMSSITKKRNFSRLSEEEEETIRKITEESATLTEATMRLHMHSSTLKDVLSEKFPDLLRKFRRKNPRASEQQIEQIKQLYRRGYTPTQISAITNIKLGVCIYQIKKHFPADPTYTTTETPTPEPQPISLEKEDLTTGEISTYLPTVPVSLPKKRSHRLKSSDEGYETIRKITEASKTLTQASKKTGIHSTTLKKILLERFPHLLKKFRYRSKNISQGQIEQIESLYVSGHDVQEISAITNIPLNVCKYQLRKLKKRFIII